MLRCADLLQDHIEQTVFFAKNAAQVGQYLRGSFGSGLVAFAGKAPPYLGARCAVRDADSPRSSKLLFSNPVELAELAGPMTRKSNYWFYEPYEWHENLSFLDTRIFANSYFLFRRYSNKLNQVRFFLAAGNGFLRTRIKSQLRDFRDHFQTATSNGSGRWVTYDTPYSEGGRGIRIGFGKEKCSPLNPMRRSCICTYEMGISQAGTVFSDAVFCSQPARVWNGANGHPFSSSCTFYDPSILDLPHIGTVSEWTRSIGTALQGLGYRGAFGCDYLYDPNTGSVFLGEANLRYTGDIALFCSGSGTHSTFRNVLHPHSLHILSFLGSARQHELADLAEGYLDFEEQGGSANKAFFDPGAPTKSNDGTWSFMTHARQSSGPPAEYLSLPVHLGFLSDRTG